MCTVSFVPVNGKYFLTSNRDEKRTRKKAIPPRIYETNNSRLICPRDGDAGGSWIALTETGDAAVLLNGAFQKHISNPPYRLSRGQIFLEVISSEDPVCRFESMNLESIEPFTLIILVNRDLYECRWDGQRRYGSLLSTHSHYIWSSATLYEKEISNQRKLWLDAFLSKNPIPSQENILNFHRLACHGDKKNALLMGRSENYSTVSITSLLLEEEQASMLYLDLPAHKIYQSKIELNSTYDANG